VKRKIERAHPGLGLIAPAGYAVDYPVYGFLAFLLVARIFRKKASASIGYCQGHLSAAASGSRIHNEHLEGVLILPIWIPGVGP
jgi:hypothetical protein